MQKDKTLGKGWPVRPPRVNDLLNKLQLYVWCQYYISLEELRMLFMFQFCTIGIRNLKYPYNIEDNH